MGTPKFKVGDKVRVLRASTDGEHNLWGDSWVSWMDKNIGKVLTISSLMNSDRNYVYYKYQLDGGCWYPEFVLQNKVVAGQQLLFDFMSKE